ncbi:hypothetical protein V501_03477 [Pseudogymnoascus sp. VKM F-4519 (FW-2642)]|uniref:Cyanovirin-N domain-containing protein n=1 Tax=Pseudogymnoascus verrucosus TaxID=342668 RepID=A0A1B8GRC7_9PEZI|nr:uncharacterized protein VE01_03108 [Pseudogymnoascus verrucosus]KFZ13885.1 hypothetical protein V501_03477 [Pseudogymnoascus sp. VKM F-4519 (FW-2642)]OBT98378.1 hypothetical protein VE01_03108 [Pseudogymnoascus verrucosus]
MHPSTLLIALLAATATALPTLDARANTSVNPDSVTFTTCTDPGVSIDSHDINVAILSICGTIAGTIQKCQGSPASTTGASGTAVLKLNVVNQGSTINVSKGRWEACMRAARAVCGNSPFKSECVGGTAGTSGGNIAFELTAA